MNIGPNLTFSLKPYIWHNPNGGSLCKSTKINCFQNIWELLKIIKPGNICLNQLVQRFWKVVDRLRRSTPELFGYGSTTQENL